MVVQFIDLDSLGILVFIFIFGTLLNTALKRVLALVSLFLKKRLLFYSILVNFFKLYSFLSFLDLILTSVIRSGWAKGLE